MIVLDIETSGLDAANCGVWQIGAIDLNTMEEFLEEAFIDEEDIIDPVALKVIGKTEDELRDKSKQTQKQLLENFLNWVVKIDEKIVMGHHAGWDSAFLQIRAMKYGMMELFSKSVTQKMIDLHTLAQMKFFDINGKFKLKDSGRSDMSLPKIADFCGIKDKRVSFQYDGTLLKEGTPHNALEDCKLTAECFSRLIEGKNLFPEFAKFEIPEVLKK